MSTFLARRQAFRKLHESGCFVLPNPWDPGTARYLAHLGFHALATTSAGFAFSRGLPDSSSALSRHMVLSHIAEIVAATDLPVNADFQAGYAADPEGVAESVRLCVATGVAGLSIEDATGDARAPLYDLPAAIERMAAARAAIDSSASDGSGSDASGGGVLLTARAECYLVGHAHPLRESIRRLLAYAEAGADVLFAPGVRAPEEIAAIVRAVHPKPVNVLVSVNPPGITPGNTPGDSPCNSPGNPGLRVADLAELGVRRVSLGSALARAAWGSFIRAARDIATEGSFAGLDGCVPFAELDDFFATASHFGKV